MQKEPLGFLGKMSWIAVLSEMEKMIPGNFEEEEALRSWHGILKKAAGGAGVNIERAIWRQP